MGNRFVTSHINPYTIFVNFSTPPQYLGANRSKFLQFLCKKVQRLEKVHRRRLWPFLSKGAILTWADGGGQPSLALLPPKKRLAFRMGEVRGDAKEEVGRSVILLLLCSCVNYLFPCEEDHHPPPSTQWIEQLHRFQFERHSLTQLRLHQCLRWPPGP